MTDGAMDGGGGGLAWSGFRASTLRSSFSNPGRRGGGLRPLSGSDPLILVVPVGAKPCVIPRVPRVCSLTYEHCRSQ
jgi:hypothetical protein